MKIILYTTGCPKCSILEKKLEKSEIEYEKITDINLMLEKGFTTVPMLEVDGEVMDYKSAFNYIESL